MIMKLGCKPSILDGSEYQFEEVPNLELPVAYTYRPFMPPVTDQGNTSTCVCHSLAAHLNWNANTEHGDNNKDNGVCIDCIYDIREDKETEGMTIKEALHYALKEGVPSKEGKLKIRKYAMVGAVQTLKQALLMNGPCIGALRVFNSYDKFWERGYYDQFLGGHAISIVGWDQEGFIIRNSWGRSWAHGGYTTLPYEDFRHFLELWTPIS